ncbi:hypothetical protein GCM10027217_25700 [Pseudomaricurvus hydrocarbonicus]
MLDLTAEGTDLAIAGAVGVTVFTRDVDASVQNAIVYGNDLTVAAAQRDLLVVVSAGGAGGAKTDTAVGISGNIHVLDNQIDAEINGGFIRLDHDAWVGAESDTLLVSVAGALGFTLDGTGVGAAIGISHANSDVSALINDADIEVGHDVIVYAHHGHQVVSVVASAGIGLENAGAGQLSLHLLTGDTDARIGGDSQIQADNNIGVIADGQVQMTTVTGGLALGGDLAVGVSLSSSDIYQRRVTATVGDGVNLLSGSQGDTTTLGKAQLGSGYAGDTLILNGVLVSANADDDIINIVVGVALSEDQALQGSVLVDTNETYVYSGIGTELYTNGQGMAMYRAAGSSDRHAIVTTNNGGDIQVQSSYDYLGVNIVGGVAGSISKFAVGASLDVSVHWREVAAEIGGYSVLDADGSVRVDAQLHATHVYVIFNAGLSGGGSAGAGAVSVPIYNDTVNAFVGGHAHLVAGDDVAVIAGHEFEHTAVNVALAAAGGNFAGGVSLGVVVQNDTVHASVGTDAVLEAGDTILVAASSDAKLADASGGIAVGGKAGAGASAFLLVRNDDVRAEVATGAALTGLALGSGLSRTTAAGTTTYRGVGVVAESREKLVGVAIQGSGGGTAGVAGAVPVSVITETTLAHVHDGVSINAGHNIYVIAKDDTELYNIAGNVAGGGTAAVGASIDIASVTKTTRASLGDPDDGSAYVATDIGVTAEAGGNIVVEAFAKEQIVSVAVGIAGAGTAAIGINGSVYVLGLNTHASIGENADVLAEGSVVVDALQDTEIDMIGASLAGAGTAAIVGTFDIPIVTKAVTATVLDGAEVVARGNLTGITTHTGTVSSNASGAGSNFINTESGSVSTPTDVIDGSLNLSIPQVDQSEAGMYLARDYSADTAVVTGVSVTATSLDDLQAITGGIAIAGNAGIAVVAGVDVADITTYATVADGVTINLNSDGLASENQSVTIAAGSALDHMGVLAAIALSGGGSVSLVGDVKALTTDTRASVGDADVYANNDIVITADTEEDLQSLVLSIAGGYIAVSPAVTVISLDATTTASVAAGAMLDADNNVLIVASHDTNIDTLNGGVAGGVGAVSPGVGVMVVEKTTTATVGDNAQVDARALYNSTDGIQGLAVKATSSENLDQVAFGAAAGIVAVGGSAAVLEVDSDTIAGINGGARINQKGYSADAAPLDQQNVEVSAHNVLEVDVVSGGMGIGLIGAGVGVGVLTVNNDTAAYLNGSVSAEDDVSVTALSDQNVHGVIFGGAGGAGALAVAVGIFDIGGDKSGSGYTYTDGNGEQVQSEATTAPSGQDENDNSTSSIDPSTDSKNAINSGVGELLSNLGPGAGSSGDDNLDKLNTSSSTITTQVEAPPTANISTTNSIPTGTSALIGANAVITSTGGNVTVLAYQNAEFEAVVGGAAIGGVAASGGVGVATLDNDVLARISAGGIIYAVGDVSVNAVLNEQAEFTGFAGAGAIGVALSATVVSLSDYSSVTAELGGTILQAGDVSVLASSNIGLYAETIQISAAAFGAGGGAATIVSSDGHTSAALLDGTVIGNVDTPTAVENVTVQAIGLLEIADIDRGSGDNNAMATGGSAGGIAVSVGYSGATDKRDTLAYIGANADVTAYSKVEVQADSSSNLDIVTKGGAGGAVATGLMFANALITDSYTSATIKSNSRVRATDITVAAKGDKLANAQTLAVAIGGVAVGGTNATTEVVANVDAAVDTAVEMIADQSITVKAESDIEGDAFVEAVSVGIVSAGGTDGIVTVTPTTTVAINDNARLSSGGGIAVYTKAGQAEVLVSTEVNNDYLLNDNLVKINRRDVNTEQLLGYQIDPATGEPEYELDENGEPTDTVILVYGNSDGSWRTAANDPVAADAVQMLYEILNLQTGDVIQLHEVGTPSADPIAEPVGGEYLDRNLSVIRIDRETVSIGTVILGQDFDVDRDTITVQQPHNFVTGDVATITDPQALVFDGNSINYDNEGTIRVPANAIYIPNHGLQNGDAFVYSAGDVAIKGLVDGETYYAITRGSDYLAFAASVEDTYSGVQRPIDLTRWGDQDGSIAVSGNLVYGAGDVRYADWVSQDSGQPGNSFYIPEHSLATGDTVTFAGVEGVGSNWAGKTFYVIAQGSDFIQLAQTRGDALMGQVFDLEVTFEPALYYFTQSQFDSSQVNVTDNSILLENFTFAIGDQVRYLPGDDSVGGLSGEDSYRVASVDGQWVTFETLDSTPVDITSVGNGSIAISNVVDFHPQWITGDDYNLDDNHLDDNNLDNDGREIPPNSLYDPRHSLQTGDQVRVSVPAQSGISGLTHNAFYFVIVTGDYLQFSSSLDNALAGIEIDLSASTATTATYVQQQAFDYNDVQFDAGVDQDATFNNSIRVAGHSYTTGMLVEINTGDVPVAGLSSGAYYAMVIDENHIRLATSQLNADTGVGIELESLGTPFINASGVLEINLGEQRITPLLDDGLSGQYRVTVIDNFTFKLQQLSINNASDTLNNTDFDQVGVNKNPGDILWDGGFRSNAFQVGDYITYYEDGLVETVSASMLGLVAVEIDFERGNGNTTITQYQFEEGSNNLYVPAHGYITGDIVEYQSANGNAGGLTAINPGRYSVVVVDENLFTLHYLVADGTHNVGDEVNVWENIEWYEFNPSFYGIDEDINPLLDLGSIHKIVNDQVVGVDGLIHGHGYYVIDKVGDDGYLNLSLTRGGEALVFVAREGSVTFSREGLDLSRSWGEFQALLDFSDLAGKNIELMGADGIDLSEVLNDVGDSKSSLTLRNTSGGAINAGTSVGQLDINVTLDTTIEGELLADGSIRVDSENKTFGSIDNQLVGIGVLGGGKRTESFLDYTENQTIHITNAVLDAGYSMVIKSETAPNMTTVANGRGGGLVDLNFANADTTVNIEQNKIFIDGTSQLLAGGREVTDFDGEPLPGMSIQAITGGLASNSSTASNGGVVAGLQINARGAYKTSFTANTGVSIVDQASLEAYELLIESKNTGIDLDSTAHLSMGGLFAGGTAAAMISSNLTADITLAGAASLTGRDGVKLNALNYDNSFNTNTTMYIIALGGGEGWSKSDVITVSKITAEAGTRVYAGADASNPAGLEVRAEDFGNNIDSSAFQAMIGSIHKNNTRTPTSSVNWDADVHIFARNTGFGLEVDASGKIISTNGVTISDYTVGDTIAEDYFFINDIAGTRNTDLAEIWIYATGLGTNSVSGSEGTFYYSASSDPLQIVNHSDKIMYVGNIDVLGNPQWGEYDSDVTIYVQGEESNTSSRALAFGIEFEDSGTDIEILSSGAAVVTGVIENRKGSTSITSLNSSVLFSSLFGNPVLRSKDVYLSAEEGSIFANIDLIDDGTGNKFEIKALDQVDLTLQSWVINGNADEMYYMVLPELSVEADVDITIEAAQVVNPTSVSGGTIKVYSFANDGAPIESESGLYSGSYRQGKTDIPVSISSGGGTLGGGYTTTYAYMDISAASISILGDSIDDFEHAIQIGLRSNIADSGRVDVLSDSYVIVEETDGDLQVGRIESTEDNVDLITWRGSILDADNSNEPNVIAKNKISLGSSDTIGRFDNALDIDGSTINFSATGDVALVEVDGDIVLNLNYYDNTTASGNIFLEALSGSIRSSNFINDTAFLVGGSIELIARNGSIGSENVSLSIDSSLNEPKSVTLYARDDVYVNENSGTLTIASAVSESGTVSVSALNTSIYINAHLNKLYDDLVTYWGSEDQFGQSRLNASGWEIRAYYNTGDGKFFDFLGESVEGINSVQRLIDVAGDLLANALEPEAENSSVILLSDVGIIEAAQQVFVEAIDDIHLMQGSRIYAGDTLSIKADQSVWLPVTDSFYATSAIGTPPSYIEIEDNPTQRLERFAEAYENVSVQQIFRGSYIEYIQTGEYEVIPSSGAGVEILVEGSISTENGAFIHTGVDADTIHFLRATLAGEVTAYGHGGDDALRVTELVAMADPIASQVDGSITGRDVLNLVGGEGVDDVTVFTHGSGDTTNEYVINVDSDAVDSVVIHGADDSDDIFLMRETLGVASYPGSFNMVSVINGTLAEATTSGGPESVQRINISTNLDRLWVSGGSGEDYFAVDSFIHTELVFAGGDGADTYALGQFFGSKRDAGAQVAALDHFGTTTQTLNSSAVEVSPSSEQPVLILDGYNAMTGEFEDKVIVSEAQHVPLGVNRAELKMVGAVLMPGELNEITFETLPDGGEILIDQDALLIVQDTLTSDQASIELEFTAGDSDITGFAFGTDLNAIEMIGLDSAASVTWSLVNGALIASNGEDDVLRLDIVADPIVANTSGTVRVTATMMGAFRHESIVNVDSLAITGITLVATDTAANQTSNSLRVIVGDVSPTLTVSGGGVNGLANEVLSGSWNAEVGADGLGAYTVTVDGADYGLDEAIAIFREGGQIATLKVMSNGVWEITATDLLQDLYINRHYDIRFGLTLADSDRDSASAFATVTLSGSKVPDIAAIGEDAFLSVTDTASTDVNSVELTYTAGGLDLVAVAFDSDLSTIVIEGLDDNAVMTWSIIDGALIGNNGSADVIKLEITADRIAALSSGTVSVTVTLLGALAHEDNVNVDVLTISGIGLVATDSEGFELQQSAAVTVYDSLPAIDAEALIPQVLQGETIRGTWTFDAGADGLGRFGVSVDGVDYTLDSPIALYGDGRQIGALTVASDGTWQLVALTDLWTVDGAATRYDLSVEIRVIDRDQDTAAVQFDLAVEVPAVVFAQIDTGVVVVDEDLIIDETSIDLTVKTGTFALATVAFDTDTSSIQIDGLDDAAAISWRIDATGALIGHDGTEDVIQLTLTYDNLIQAESEGVVRLTATLLGAMSHEDFVNVDSLSISGVALILKDGWGYTVTQTVGVTVLDDQPVVGLSSSDHIGNDRGGEVHSGSWNVDMGADAGGTIMVLVNGQEFAIGETIEWVVGTDYVGDLTLHEDGSWTFVAQKKTYDETALVMDMSFELVAIDADGDRVSAQTTFTVTRNLGRANNGVGNGLDSQPPGNPPENDTNDAVPGSPGNQGGADYDSDLVVSTLELDSSETQTLIMVTAAGATPSVAPQEETDEIWIVDDVSTALERLLDAESAPLNLVSQSSMTAVGEEWTVL